jgi:Asp-tRNA(Asn)/Glu-tRNA(Gln) amidotransferase A subunit family amidase
MICMRQDAESDVDSSEAVHGAPTTIQLIARNYQDEELMAASALIDQCLNQ